jgi:hypothetical protein
MFRAPFPPSEWRQGSPGGQRLGFLPVIFPFFEGTQGEAAV